MAQDYYSEATQENGQLEIHLGASQAALLTTEEEASAARVRLAEFDCMFDCMVAGKMNSKKTLISISIVLVLIALFVSVITSPDGAVGEPPTSVERGYDGRQHPRCLTHQPPT